MAATIYEPLSTAHLKSCTVDFDSRPDKKAVNLVQYDQTIPVLCVSLKKGGTEYKVPSDADVNIRMDKRDGYHVYNPALGVNAERTIAYFAVTPQMSTGWGDYYPIVEITVGGGIAGSAPIWLHFDRNPLPENAIISSDEYKTIQQLLEDVTAVKAATEQIKAQTEAVRDQAKGFADNAKNSADKAQTLVDGMPSDYSQAMKDIGTLKNQMQRAYPDDSTIGENPWSSKNIVDMLCPPIEESSNPVVCYPVAGYPLGVKAKWEPIQEGSGTPSPENIRPIKGRNSVTVERCGENLVKFPYYTSSYNKNGLVFTAKQDGSITVDGTATADTWYIVEGGIDKRLPMNTPMTLSGCPAGGALKSYYIGLYIGGKWFTDVGDGNTNVKLTTRKIDSRVEVSIAKGVVCNSLTFYPKIEVGTTITPYSKYQGSTNTMTLPETVYGGEVDAVSGEVAETWGLVTFDGTENWVVSGKFLDNKTDWYYTLPKIPNAVNAVPQKGNEICSHYPHADVSNNNNVQGCAIVLGNIRVRWGDTIPNDADAWKAYLAAQKAAGTPVQVAYKLATQTPFTATGAQPIPALAGMNTVLTDADSVTVMGRADPIKRITDLEDAVASQT